MRSFLLQHKNNTKTLPFLIEIKPDFEKISTPRTCERVCIFSTILVNVNSGKLNVRMILLYCMGHVQLCIQTTICRQNFTLRSLQVSRMRRWPKCTRLPTYWRDSQNIQVGTLSMCNHGTTSPRSNVCWYCVQLRTNT